MHMSKFRNIKVFKEDFKDWLEGTVGEMNNNPNTKEYKLYYFKYCGLVKQTLLPEQVKQIINITLIRYIPLDHSNPLHLLLLQHIYHTYTGNINLEIEK